MNSWKFLFKPISLGILFALPIGWMSWHNWLQLGQIDCQLDNDTCPKSLMADLDTLKSTSLFLINEESIPLPPSIQVSSFKKNLPSTLILDLKSQLPGMIIQLDELKSINTNLELSQQTKLIKKTLEENQVKVVNIDHDLNQSTLVINLDNNVRALLPTHTLNQSLSHLILITSNLNFDDIDLKIVEVDLRYKLPVLRTSISNLNQ
jgi:hypothetical protein